MDLLDDYRADGVDFEMHASGLLMAFRSAESLEAHQGDLDLLESYGWASQVLVGDAVREQEPALADEVVGGISFSGDRHVDPAGLMRGLHRRCLGLGVEIVEDTAVDGVEWRGTRVTAVTAGQRRFAGDAFLLAAGAWSGALSKRFGRSLPIQPGKGYSVDLPRLELRAPVYLTEARVAVTPLDDKLRLAGTLEFGGLDERIDPARVRAISRAPAAFFRDWHEDAEPVLGAGVRPMSPDGLPLIGRLGRLPNVYVSTGHAMLGVTLGPATAAAAADLVLAGHTGVPIAPIDPARFAQPTRT
jgi:D-amino-acid dehydrogenase